MSLGTNLPLIPPRVQEKIVVATNNVKVVLADFPTPIITKIGIEPTRESQIDLHQLIGGNAASVALNLRGGQHGHPALKMTDKEYI